MMAKPTPHRALHGGRIVTSWLRNAQIDELRSLVRDVALYIASSVEKIKDEDLCCLVKLSQITSVDGTLLTVENGVKLRSFVRCLSSDLRIKFVLDSTMIFERQESVGIDRSKVMLKWLDYHIGTVIYDNANNKPPLANSE